MSPRKAQFVTACQQLLALGVVLAVLTPATGVVSLDVILETPASAPGTTAGGIRPVAERSLVEAEPVEARVTEREMRPVGRTVGAARRTGKAGRSAVSAPEPVAGFGTVGVTWSARGKPVAEDRIDVRVRTRTRGAWSGWTALEYAGEHGPDPGSDEAAQARPGTDPLVVGDVDEVQARATVSNGAIPEDLRLAVVEPGRSGRTERARPAIDTASFEATGRTTHVTSQDGAADAIALAAGSHTPKPTIYSRAQWGADERLRDAGSVRYHEIHAGFVHHTVNSNSYTAAQVPSIIRSIYAYHVRSRGWNDIGYNFLVDRFGRIWEGRYGGVTRPVVGAHTQGYNDYSFAMSAIGNFESVEPSSAMLRAYAALMAWKLSLHGVDAASTNQRVGSGTFQAVNGHRDAGSTACPGRYLYARIPTIRTLANAAQADWSGREREMDLVSTRHPDLLLRRTSDNRLYLLPTGGQTRFLRPTAAASGYGEMTAVVGSPDLTGDGRPDVLARNEAGSAAVHPGTASGTFGKGVGRTRAFRGFTLITAVGDLNGDRRNDLVGRWPKTGQLFTFLGDGSGGFKRVRGSKAFAEYDLLTASSDLTGDGRRDLAGRTASGRLVIHAGNGRGGFAPGVAASGNWSGFDVIAGYGDFTGDGRSDLLVRSARTRLGYVIPSRGNGTFGRARGPIRSIRRLGGVGTLGHLVGNAAPDLLGRRGDELFVVRNSGGVETRPVVRTNVDLAGVTAVLNVGDWDRDGRGDIMLRTGSGALHLRRGNGVGGFSPAIAIGSGFDQVRLLAAVGDTTGDGWPDLMGQKVGGDLGIFPGRGLDGLAHSYRAHAAITAGRQIGIGRWDTDGAPDSLFWSGRTLTLYRGNGPGGLTTSQTLALDLTGYDRVVGIADLGVGGHPDLVLRSREGASGAGQLWAVNASASRLGKRRLLSESLTGYDLLG